MMLLITLIYCVLCIGLCNRRQLSPEYLLDIEREREEKLCLWGNMIFYIFCIMPNCIKVNWILPNKITLCSAKLLWNGYQITSYCKQGRMISVKGSTVSLMWRVDGSVSNQAQRWTFKSRVSKHLNLNRIKYKIYPDVHSSLTRTSKNKLQHDYLKICFIFFLSL